MIEVFKTNVTSQVYADMLVEQIRKSFAGYVANFDLEDCDRILRVENTDGSVKTQPVIRLLNDFGFKAEVLPDETPEQQPQHLSCCILRSMMRAAV